MASGCYKIGLISIASPTYKHPKPLQFHTEEYGKCFRSLGIVSECLGVGDHFFEK
jgi:hypothetical protein